MVSCRLSGSSCTWHGIFTFFKNECFYGSILFTLLEIFLLSSVTDLQDLVPYEEGHHSEQQALSQVHAPTFPNPERHFCCFSCVLCLLTTRVLSLYPAAVSTNHSHLLSLQFYVPVYYTDGSTPSTVSIPCEIIACPLSLLGYFKVCEEEGPVDFCYHCAP